MIFDNLPEITSEVQGLPGSISKLMMRKTAYEQ